VANGSSRPEQMGFWRERASIVEPGGNEAIVIVSLASQWHEVTDRDTKERPRTETFDRNLFALFTHAAEKPCVPDETLC